MRFSQGLKERLNPAWTGAYFDYEWCKTLTRSLRNEHLDDFLAGQAKTIDNFLRQQGAALARQSAVINHRYGIALAACRPEYFHRATAAELDELNAHCARMVGHASSLLEYVRVTQAAVERIRTKLDWPSSESYAFIPLSEIVTRAECLSVVHLRIINETLRCIKNAMDRQATAPGIRRASLLMSSLVRRFGIDDAEQLEDALCRDKADDLATLLPQIVSRKSQGILQGMLRGFVQVAIVHDSRACLSMLLPQLSRLPRAGSDPSWSDYLPLYVSYLGRHSKGVVESRTLLNSLRSVLNGLEADELQSALTQTDSFGRLALHYAAEFDMPDICEELSRKTQDGIDLNPPFPLLQDAFGESPIQVAIRLGHADVVDVLIPDITTMPHAERERTMGQQLVETAIRSDKPGIARRILNSVSARDIAGERGSELVLLAAQYGSAVIVQALLAKGVDTNAAEPVLGRTPLMEAAARGHVDIAKALLAAGCDADRRDYSYWRAVDHAAYRGIPQVVDLLVEHARKKSPGGTSLDPAAGSGLAGDPARLHPETYQRIAQSSSHSYVFINLGSLDLEKKINTAVDIEPYRRASAPVCVPDASLTLRVSAIGCDKAEFSIRFPILEDLTNKPWKFSTTDPDGAGIVFELFSSVVDETRPIGTGVALLGTLRGGLGPLYESLVREHTVPLLSPGSRVQLVGSITFNLLVVRPFTFSGPLPTPRLSLPRGRSTIVAGHRGLGQNDKEHQHLQLGENTLHSFQKALELGASVVEFDVQVTKDLVPVIYHDFLVSETGTHSYIHNLSYKQFTVLSDIQSLPEEAKLRTGNTASRTRTRSVGSRDIGAPADLVPRMRTTFDYAQSGFKPNTRGECIHQPFANLKELLTELDDGSAPFDIEIKYPMLYEARYWEMDTVAMELNLFLDTILNTVYQHAGKRPIFFSSFSPECCIALAAKQRLYPVLFLNDAGNWPAYDARATSLQQAVRFARRWCLDGVVTASEPLVASPGLTGLVRQSGFGLYCASYGPLNDDPAAAVLQAQAGLDCICVNRVRRIRLALDAMQGVEK